MAYKISELLNDYRSKVANTKLNFEMLPEYEEHDVYNLAAPLVWNDEIWLLARVEKRDSEQSMVGFFQPLNPSDTVVHEIQNWKQIEITGLVLQDPFYTIIEDELVVGGVEVTGLETGENVRYRTAFYRGTDIRNLEHFVDGPWGMKDIRLNELEDGRVLLLTRPQGEVGGRGTIGYKVLDNLEELTIEHINSAVLLPDMFEEEAWGGANEIYTLSTTEVGVLSHIAEFDQAGDGHYYASSFILNVETGEVRDFKIIAERRDFTDGPSKREDLKDVLFSGGLIRHDEGYATLYCGVSDCEAHKILIVDPFVG